VHAATDRATLAVHVEITFPPAHRTLPATDRTPRGHPLVYLLHITCFPTADYGHYRAVPVLRFPSLVPGPGYRFRSTFTRPDAAFARYPHYPYPHLGRCRFVPIRCLCADQLPCWVTFIVYGRFRLRLPAGFCLPHCPVGLVLVLNLLIGLFLLCFCFPSSCSLLLLRLPVCAFPRSHTLAVTTFDPDVDYRLPRTAVAGLALLAHITRPRTP